MPIFDKAVRVSELINWTTHTVTVPAQNGVYLIKPITSSGVRSKNPAKTVISTQALILRDWYAQPRFNPDFAGQFINCEKVGDDASAIARPQRPERAAITEPGLLDCQLSRIVQPGFGLPHYHLYPSLRPAIK